MLFDVRGRRGTLLKAAYLALAATFMIASIVFYIGPNGGSGTLVDAIRAIGDSGGGRPAEELVAELERKVADRPDDAGAWSDLVVARMQAASIPANFDRESGQATDAGKRALRPVVEAWKRYLGLVPVEIPLRTARAAAAALTALGLTGDALEAQRIVAARKPSAGGYAGLAQAAYSAGLEREGDRAARKAIKMVPSKQRPKLRKQFAQLRALQELQAKGLSKDGRIPIEALANGGGARKSAGSSPRGAGAPVDSPPADAGTPPGLDLGGPPR